MQRAEDLSLDAMGRFVEGSENLEFSAESSREVYSFVDRILRTHGSRLRRPERGFLKRFLQKLTGLCRAQLTRLITRWQSDGQLQPRRGRRRRFLRKYTDEDIARLARRDEAHENLSGPATKRILEREFTVYGNSEYERLAGISVSHIYNLRRRQAYRRISYRPIKPQAAQVSIGERRKPDPRNRPGWLRVDTVPAPTEPRAFITSTPSARSPRQVVGAAEAISEAQLLPVLEAILHQFPFRIEGFHADNGSEFINHQVVGLLNRMLVGEFTKSRANRTTAHALVEGKNGAVVRKHIGYGWISRRHAEQFDRFYRRWLNPYLHFHRPCGFAQVVEGRRGRRKRIYRQKDYATPFEKLRSLSDWESYLKDGVSAEQLTHQTMARSDIEFAQAMQAAKQKLLAEVRQGWRSA